MHSLNDTVKLKTVTGVMEGTIIGRTLSNPAWYDVKTAKGVVLNQPEQNVVSVQ